MKISSLNFNAANKAVQWSKVSLESAARSNNFTFGNSHRVFQARQTLLSAGDPFQGLYIMRSGSAKAFITSACGEECITKFFFPGDLLGVDGFDQHVHSQNIVFLETSSVCFLKESDVYDLVKNSDDFRTCLFKSMSHTLLCDSLMMMCLSSCSSEQKVAHFLLELADHFTNQGLSGREFRLSMTRTDIANYLGMALETVCRVLASFQLKRVISVSNRHLIILDAQVLNQILSRDSHPSSLATSLDS
jgi:CRP/FNR family transcriptional regulator